MHLPPTVLVIFVSLTPLLTVFGQLNPYDVAHADSLFHGTCADRGFKITF